MFGKVDEEEGAQALVGQARRQQGNGPRDPAFCAQPPQPSRNCRRRQGNALRQLIGGHRIVLLHKVEQGEVETVEHGFPCQILA